MVWALRTPYLIKKKKSSSNYKFLFKYKVIIITAVDFLKVRTPFLLK